VATWADTWEQTRRSWSAGWNSLYDRVRSTVVPAVEKDPEASKPDVQRMLLILKEWQAANNRAMEAASALPYGPDRNKAIANVIVYVKRWGEYAAPFYAHTSATSAQPVIGVVPVLILGVPVIYWIGGLAVTSLAAAWAMTSWQNANADAARASAYSDYLVAYSEQQRACAAAPGRPCPPPPTPPDFEAIASTVPDPLSKLAEGASSLVGLAVAGAVAIGAITFLMRRG
jgi:hypothetical protein